jgi:hypothetical protein
MEKDNLQLYLIRECWTKAGQANSKANRESSKINAESISSVKQKATSYQITKRLVTLNLKYL